MNRIRELREMSKLTQLELAVELGVERTAVTKWETGRSFPRSDKLPAIARLLNCTIDDLYAKPPEPAPAPPEPLTEEKREWLEHKAKLQAEMAKILAKGR